MSFILKDLNTIKEKVEKEAVDAEYKYYYLKGALDFILESNRGLITPLPAPVTPVPVPIPVKPPMPIHGISTITSNIEVKHVVKRRQSPYTSAGYIALYRSKALTALAMCGNGCFMDAKEIMKYLDLTDPSTYQYMNIALKQLTEEGKIVRQRKIGIRRMQYEYRLPGDGNTRIITNGEIAQQQRKV